MKKPEITILAFDDNYDNLISLKALIKESFPGSIMLTAANGAAGLELAQTEEPSVILLDVVMPGMDGFEVCQILKANPKTRDIPVVFLTALKGDRESRIHALEVGAEAFLAKPIDETELTVQIRAMLKIKVANDQKRNEIERLAQLVAEQTHELEQTHSATLNLLEELREENEARKNNDIKLGESEDKYKLLHESAGVGIGYYSPDGDVISYNTLAAMNMGGKPEDFNGRSIYELFPKMAADRYMERIRKSAASEEKEEYEDKVDLPGEQKWFFSVFTRILNSSNHVVGVQIISTDISSRKLAEEALRESELHYRSLFNNMLNGFAYCQMLYENNVPRDFIYLDVNKEFEKLTGLRNVVGKKVSEAIPGIQETDPELIKTYGRVALTGNPEIFEIYVEALKDWYSISVYSPEKGHFVSVFDVITARKLAEKKLQAAHTELKGMLIKADESRQVLLNVVEDQNISAEKLGQLNAELDQRVQVRTAQLETANKELEAFSYSVSHDLRAPLRGIDGWSLALLEDYRDQLDENGRQYLDRVRGETQRMGQLIDDLLELSRVNRVEMKRGSINLSDLARAISARLQEENRTRQVEFVIPPGLTASGDPNLLEIALTNLLSNATKFSGNQPLPRIEFGKTFIDGKAAYFIRDNGAGFDMAFAKNLFGAFQRMHKQTEFPGSGIGLATVQRIIHRHGGKVWAEAQKDQGATFYFTLEETV